MQYVMFGNTGMKVSRFALGAMTFGSRLDLPEAARVVDEAIDHGVNLIDTADSYGDSEQLLGQILSPDKREKVFVATKVFRRFCREGRVGRNSRTNIVNSLERSLRLLNTDYVDLYQLHHPDDETPIEKTLDILDSLVDQGKIRYIGVSNHYAWQMALMLGESKLHGWAPLVSLQANYSILDRQIESEAVPLLSKLNIALMCYGPLCGGILTGKYHGPEGIPGGSRGATNRKVVEYVEDPGVRSIVAALVAIALECGLGMNQVAILWLMAKPYATTLILGGTRPEHFADIYSIAEQSLPPEVIGRIDALSASRVHTDFANQPFRWGPGLFQRR